MLVRNAAKVARHRLLLLPEHWTATNSDGWVVPGSSRCSPAWAREAIGLSSSPITARSEAPYTPSDFLQSIRSGHLEHGES